MVWAADVGLIGWESWGWSRPFNWMFVCCAWAVGMLPKGKSPKRKRGVKAVFVMSLSVNHRAGVPNSGLCTTNWTNNSSLSGACSSLSPQTFGKKKKKKQKRNQTLIEKLLLFPWWAYSLDGAQWFSTLEIKRPKEQREEERKEKKGRLLCLKSWGLIL